MNQASQAGRKPSCVPVASSLAVGDEVVVARRLAVTRRAGGARRENAPTKIPFNQPFSTGDECGYIDEAIANRHLSGNGPFSSQCARWLEDLHSCEQAFLTTSGTSALEMAMLVADIGPGDEVIMPSFTFVTTASSVALRGATPVFVDVREDTLNLDERRVEAAITSRTRAIVPVHYAGVGCELAGLLSIANRHGLAVIEDAAQGVAALYRSRPLGSHGDLGCISFHETKNLICGEGGALLVNRHDWVERAAMIHEKGTDRVRFLQGHVDKYSWLRLGSSFLMSEINAAFLWAQIEHAEEILMRRMTIWHAYHQALAPLEEANRLRRPMVPNDRRHNAHMYYVLLKNESQRSSVIASLAEQDIHALFHYVPLHSSPGGRRYGRVSGDMKVTDQVSQQVLRLPLWVEMSETDVERVCSAIDAAL